MPESLEVSPAAQRERVRPCDLLYIEGPGDIVAAFDSWSSGMEFPDETSVTYSSQVFQHCRELGLRLVAVSYGGPAKERSAGDIVVMNLPRAAIRVPKIGYDLTLLLYAIRLSWLVIRLRPKRTVVTAGVVQWWVAPWIARLGTEVVPVLHNALWPNGSTARLRAPAFRWWRKTPPRTLVVSPVIRRQVESLAEASGSTVIEFRPSFIPEEFLPPQTPHGASDTFRILFVGRLEFDKGALDLVDIASALREASPEPFLIEVCGDGSARTDFDKQVSQRSLEGVVVSLGRLARAKLVTRYAMADVCIVPTRGSFGEGYAQVVAEAILLGCPVLTSPVVPAAELYPKAVVLARTDDVSSYVRALVQLIGDRAHLARLSSACTDYREAILTEPATFQRALRQLDA